MDNLKVLDVTLRDGGCVNNFNFGQSYMERILSAQEKAGIDVIELGYLDEVNGTESGRTQYRNEKVIKKCLLKNKKHGTSYVAMVDYGKFNIDKLEARTEDGIDGIRLAFHKEHCEEMVEAGRRIMQKGYEFYIQPMITLRYSDSELLQLIQLVNEKLADAMGFYIVDSFGEMRQNDMNRLLNLVDYNLLPQMTLGFHSHNNLQMSYSNAIAMLQFPTKRKMMMDSSIMGMGKGAGNLNTELLLEHLNIFYGKSYDITPLLEVIDKVINPIHAEFYWGYAPEYYLSSANHCTPSYASHYYNRHMLPIDQVGELLGKISEEKRISFDKEYAEELYRSYNAEKDVDDSEVVKEFKKLFSEKDILLVAPGKSIIDAQDVIKDYMNRSDVVTIGLNTEIENIDYLLATRKDIYEKAINDNRNIIVCSNVSKGGRGNVKVLNYKNWIMVDERTEDSSLVIVLNLLKSCNVKRIYLAGFDGFRMNINENYFEPSMRNPITIEQVEIRNKFNKEFINSIRKSGIKIEFLTKSLYEKEYK